MYLYFKKSSRLIVCLRRNRGSESNNNLIALSNFETSKYTIGAEKECGAVAIVDCTVY